MAETFTCAKCKETFKKAWSDKEAVEEYNQLWETTDENDLVLLCDDCFQKYCAWAKNEGLVKQ